MLSTTLLGSISLNLSFVLYLFIYLPQVLHNRNTNNLVNLSVAMHLCLYCAYVLDLFYGYSHQLQWQYKTVSMVSLCLIGVQHVQITWHLWQSHQRALFSMNVLFLLASGLLILYFFIIRQGHFSAETTLTIGYLSRTFFLLYTLPQIIKNKILKQANAISRKFIYLSITLSALDLTSAWCLDWGWPNKLAAPVSILCMLVLLTQMMRYPYHHEVRPDQF